jgi:hypothetical protein
MGVRGVGKGNLTRSGCCRRRRALSSLHWYREMQLCEIECVRASVKRRHDVQHFTTTCYNAGHAIIQSTKNGSPTHPLLIPLCPRTLMVSLYVSALLSSAIDVAHLIITGNCSR